MGPFAPRLKIRARSTKSTGSDRWISQTSGSLLNSAGFSHPAKKAQRDSLTHCGHRNTGEANLGKILLRSELAEDILVLLILMRGARDRWGNGMIED